MTENYKIFLMENSVVILSMFILLVVWNGTTVILYESGLVGTVMDSAYVLTFTDCTNWCAVTPGCIGITWEYFLCLCTLLGEIERRTEVHGAISVTFAGAVEPGKLQCSSIIGKE